MVRQHEGAVVKTIGDAVMAAFSDPAKAMAAALAVQHRVAAFNAAQPGEDLIINMGLHLGRCIVVTLNDRLDYFGSMVNMAARLQAQSRGGDVVVSDAMAADPAVAQLLRTYRSSSEHATLKGFASPVSFRRLTHADILAVG
jgi:class 3 adenylate cyclase